LNSPNNQQQQILSNNQLSQSVSNVYENRQQNSLTFENEVKHEAVFSQPQYQINTNNDNTQVITEGRVNNKTSYNVNDTSSYNNLSQNHQNVNRSNMNNQNRGLPPSNVYSSNNGNSNFNSSGINNNNNYNQNSVNLHSQYGTTEIPYFFNGNGQNNQNGNINTQNNYQQQQNPNSIQGQDNVDTLRDNYELYKTPYSTIPQSFNSDQHYITLNGK